MKSTDDAIQYLLVITHIMHFVFASEAIFFVDKLPNKRAIIICISLNVRIYVEVLSLIVFLVLYMPYPVIAFYPLRRPFFYAMAARRNTV